MALAERRTLAIEARLRDLMTGPLTKMERSLSRFQVVAGRALGVASVAVASLVGTAVLGFRQFLKVAEGLDAIAKASENLNITVESLTAIRSGAETAGVSIDELGTAMKAFQKVVDEANEGNTKQRELLDRVGLVAREFADEQLNVVDVLAQVADGLKGVESAAARTAITVALFGRSGQQLGSLLKEGGEGIRRMATEADQLGMIFTNEELQRVARFKDAWEKLGHVFRALAERVVIDLAPAFTDFLDGLKNQLSGDRSTATEAIKQFVSVTVDALELLAGGLRLAQRAVLGFKGLSEMATQAGIQMAKFTASLTGNKNELAIWNIAAQQSQERGAAIVDALKALDEQGTATGKMFADLRAKIASLQSQTEGRTSILPPIIVQAERPPQPEVWEDYWRGFTEGADKAIAKWQDFEKAGTEAATMILDAGLDHLTDAIASVIDGTNNAKQAFKQFAIAVLEDLAKIIAKLLVMEGLNLILGLEKGGVVPADSFERGGIKRYAGGGVNRSGGVATRPTVMFGEGSTAEAFVPLPDNRSIPVSFVGGAEPGGTTVQFFISAVDAKGVQQMLIEQHSTLRSLWESSATHRVGMRQVVQRTAR